MEGTCQSLTEHGDGMDHTSSDYTSSLSGCPAESPLRPCPQPTLQFPSHRTVKFLNYAREATGGTEDAASEKKRTSSVIQSDDNAGPENAACKRTRTSDVSLKVNVKKEKLGERITALQQLVSPFGKTDTASVLLEAIGYIRFLQDQVQVLSTPYLKSIPAGRNSEGRGDDSAKCDLRSRGLCLMPLSSTQHVTNNNGADFWASGIGAARDYEYNASGNLFVFLDGNNFATRKTDKGQTPFV